MVKRYVCKGCNKGCRSGVTHKCQETCNDCPFHHAYIHMFESRASLVTERSEFNRALTCIRPTNWRERQYVSKRRTAQKVCSLLDPRHKHDCFKPFCDHCLQNRETGRLCYMRILVNELPRSDNVLFVFYDFETTQDTKFSDSATEHIPNLVCLQQFCTRCETQPDISVDCEEKAFLLWRPRRWPQQSMCASRVVWESCRSSTKRQRHLFEMATQTNFERFENYLYADSASDIYRFCFISTYATA